MTSGQAQELRIALEQLDGLEATLDGITFPTEGTYFPYERAIKHLRDLLVARLAAEERALIQTIGLCSRCSRPLDNVSPGFSVVAGGAFVCVLCLQPGEEIARARGI